MSTFFCVVLYCPALAMGRSFVQEVLEKRLKCFIVPKFNSEPEQARELEP